MNIKWDANSILNTYTETTPCKEIFQAVCDEIGNYYTKKGWRYSRSRPKITYKNKHHKLEIAFWSSGSNMQGDYVALEIIPSFYSLELIKHLKEKGEKSNGYIIGFSQLFREKLDTNIIGKKVIINAYDEKIERIDEYDTVPELIFNKSVNVYGIDEDKFEKIIHFINEKIINWVDRIDELKSITSLIEKLTDRDRLKVKGSSFEKYINLKFPSYIIDF